MKVSLVIVTEIIAPYRIPVFNALAQRPEIDLHVVFLSENDRTLRQWHVYKEEIKFRYSVLPSWRCRFGKYNLLLNRGVRSTLRRANPDLLLCGGYNYLACWAAAAWARAHRVPLLLWAESTSFDRRGRYAFVELMKRRFLRLCNAFVVPGKSSREYLQKLGIEESRIFTAPNAIDIALFSQAAMSAHGDETEVRARHGLPERYFLYVGRLIKAKGIFDLMNAYALLQPNIRSSVGLVFVGDGADRQELLSQASKTKPGTIQILGFAHREQLPEIYALAGCLIFPTHTDPWGLVVNEAMACGLPVIASSVAGVTADLVKDGWNGFVVSPSDTTALAAAMEKLATDHELQREMGFRSRQRIEEYSPEAWAEGVVHAVFAARHPQAWNW